MYLENINKISNISTTTKKKKKKKKKNQKERKKMEKKTLRLDVVEVFLEKF